MQRDKESFAPTRFRPKCFTCGANLGDKEEAYKRLIHNGKTPAEALESLGITRPCCRIRTLWPIVLPLGGFYLPHQEAALANYQGIKEQPPMPTMVLLSLRRALTGEIYLVSHVDRAGFIGKTALTGESYSRELPRPTPATSLTRPTLSQPLSSGERPMICPDEEFACSVNILTEQGEITRMFPYEVRGYQHNLQVDRVKSFFDLPLEDQKFTKIDDEETHEHQHDHEHHDTASQDERLIDIGDDEPMEGLESPPASP